MTMTTPTSQAARKLPIVHPDVAKTLTIIALLSVSFHFCGFEDLGDFLIPS
jgi:hypothetical protein